VQLVVLRQNVLCDVKSKSHTMVLLVEVGNKGTGIVVCCQRMRRGRLLVWLTVACVGVDGLAGAGFCCGYLCGCTPGIEKMGSGDLKTFLLSRDGGRCLDCSVEISVQTFLY